MNTPSPLTNPPFATSATYDAPDWEERYRQLFERSETFMLKLCNSLKMDYVTASENDVLTQIEKLLIPLSVKKEKPHGKTKKRKKLA